MTIARRTEENALAVRSPTQNFIGIGMIRKATRDTASSRNYVHVTITFIFATERDERSVRRENGMGFKT